jgi:hypothetical protein
VVWFCSGFMMGSSELEFMRKSKVSCHNVIVDARSSTGEIEMELAEGKSVMKLKIFDEIEEVITMYFMQCFRF